MRAFHVAAAVLCASVHGLPSPRERPVTDDPSINFRISAEAGSLMPGVPQWNVDLWDKGLSDSSLLYATFDTVGEANKTVQMLKQCTAATCTLVHHKCVKPEPWTPCQDWYTFHDNASNKTLAQANPSVGVSPGFLASEVWRLAPTAPVLLKRYCICTIGPGGEARFWECTKQDFEYVEKNGKCPPKADATMPQVGSVLKGSFSDSVNCHDDNEKYCPIWAREANCNGQYTINGRRILLKDLCRKSCNNCNKHFANK